jgi:hypothetical protein
MRPKMATRYASPHVRTRLPTFCDAYQETGTEDDEEEEEEEDDEEEEEVSSSALNVEPGTPASPADAPSLPPQLSPTAHQNTKGSVLYFVDLEVIQMCVRSTPTLVLQGRHRRITSQRWFGVSNR